MLAFRLASQGDRVKLALDSAGLNITAYAVRSDRGEVWLTLVNKEATRDAPVRVSCQGVSKADVIRLTAPSLSSKDGVLLGGSQVSIFGKWTPGVAEPVRVRGGEMEIAVPAASAAIVRLH
jgi:alpha-L-arabinofuranosidase